MTFTTALLIVLALAAIALGLLAYYLFSRLYVLETAVAGGMRTPSRTLSRQEFARRYAIARKRADFAAEHGTGVVVFLDDAAPSTELLRTISALTHGRGFSLRFAGDAPHDIQHFETQSECQSQFEELGVVVLPYGMVIDAGNVLDARPIGSPDTLDQMLLEVA